jgi:hypothetical protein
VLRLREVYRQAASFRQPAVLPEAARGAVARLEVSASRHLRRAAVVYRAAPSALRQPEAFRPEERRS